MLAAYGVDTLDERVSVRRVWVLANRLPPWARHGGRDWASEAELLALLIDHVADLSWITARAAGAQNVPRPRPIPRPAEAHASEDRRSGTAQEPRGGGWADAARQLAGMRGVSVADG